MTLGSEDTVVLVAEDSLVVRALLRAQLRERGYSVIEAADGDQALARARELRPDVVLLDVDMPKLDGFAVLAEMKADANLCDVPVVFITGRTTPEDAVKGLELGAHDYLRKPFEAAELTARIHAAVRTKRLQDELRLLNAELMRLANTDVLTRLANRRALDHSLTQACSRSARHASPLALLLLDVDGFKAVNDRYGHHIGDEVLVDIAGRLRGRLRTEDVLGRWGGEQFMVIAPDIDEDGAASLAEALRRQIGAPPIETSAGPVPVTASLGWSFWNGDDPEELIRRAERALQLAKDSGRDRAVGPSGG